MSQLRSGTTEVVAPDGQVSDDFSAYSYTVVIRESADSLCRDGADAQYMQYLSKSRIT